MSQPILHRTGDNDGRWQAVPVLAYKQDGSASFRDVTRQVLFEGGDLECELRYFEVGPGGHTTLERHAHTHAVMILRGRGHCLVGHEIFDLVPYDLVRVPALVWHQFRASADEPLGFLCMVSTDRDRPQLPSAEDLAILRAHAAVNQFIRA